MLHCVKIYWSVACRAPSISKMGPCHVCPRQAHLHFWRDEWHVRFLLARTRTLQHFPQLLRKSEEAIVLLVAKSSVNAAFLVRVTVS